MSFRRSIATGAFAAVVAMSSVLPAGAQGFGGGPPPYTPEPGAKDLKSVLYNWTWHMGMLRGQAEPELVGTLEYQAQGTIQVEGQPCALTKYRISANYQIPGYRTQIACSRPNGQTYASEDPEKLPERVIHVVNVLARAELQKLPLREAIRASDELVNQFPV